MLFEKPWLHKLCLGYSILTIAACLVAFLSSTQMETNFNQPVQATFVEDVSLNTPSMPSFCNDTEIFSFFQEIGIPFVAVERGVSYVGSGCRLRRVLSRAQLGDTLKVGMIGGSISAFTPLYNYGTVFTDWLNKVFPTTQGPHVLINGAIRATGSSYFSYCVQAQIGNDADIVLIDLAINDYSADLNINMTLERIQQDMLPDEEILIRTLLSQSNGPAIIFVHFGKIDHALNFQNAAMQLDMLAQFYDLSSVSYKQMMFSAQVNTNVAYKFFSRHWRQTVIGGDSLHPAPSGHKLASYLLIYMIQQHVIKCRTRESSAEWNITLSPDAKNSAFEPGCDFQLIDKQLDGPGIAKNILRRHTPVCMSIQALHPNLQPTEVKGNWQLFTLPQSTKTYWQSVKPSNESLITFSIKPKQTSRVFMYTLKATYISGIADCWLDDHRESAVTIQGFSSLKENVGVRTLIGETRAGAHTLRCSHTSGEDFRIIGIFHD